MFAAVGNKVKTIHRISIGHVQLSDLKEGNFRKLTSQEVNGFLNQVD